MAAAEGQKQERPADRDDRLGVRVGKIVTPAAALAFLLYVVLDFIVAFPVPAERADTALSRGVQHYRRGELDQAKAAWDEAARLDPDEFRAYYFRGLLAEERGDRDGAIDEYDAAIRAHPKRKWGNLDHGLELPNIHLRRVDLLAARGDVEAAIAELGDADRLDNGGVDMVLRRGSLRLDQGDVAGAIADFDESIRRIPSNAAGWLERGKVKLFLYGDSKGAAEDLAVAMREALSYRTFRELLDAGTKAPLVKEVVSRPMLYNRRPFVPEAYHLLIWLHLSRARSGEPDAEELAKNVEELAQPIWRELIFRVPGNGGNAKDEARKIALGVWPGPVIELFFGTAYPAWVRETAAAATDEAVRRVRLCDADFYLAAYSVEKGKREEARRLYKAAADGCPPGTIGKFAAGAELTRLSP
jgi:tetratricopeptide (TPR) repeat protein